MATKAKLLDLNLPDGKTQYNNLNLKQKLQNSSSHAFPEPPKSISNEKIEALKYVKKMKRTAASANFLDFPNNHDSKRDSHSLNKSAKNIYLEKIVGYQNEDEWKKDKNATNGSTLSLHISTYEDSVEAENTKQIFAVSKIAIQNSFEFPRQQSDKVAEPETSHFKASRRLLNPNNASKNARQQQPPLNSESTALVPRSSNLQMVSKDDKFWNKYSLAVKLFDPWTKRLENLRSFLRCAFGPLFVKKSLSENFCDELSEFLEVEKTDGLGGIKALNGRFGFFLEDHPHTLVPHARSKRLVEYGIPDFNIKELVRLIEDAKMDVSAALDILQDCKYLHALVSSTLLVYAIQYEHETNKTSLDVIIDHILNMEFEIKCGGETFDYLKAYISAKKEKEDSKRAKGGYDTWMDKMLIAQQKTANNVEEIATTAKETLVEVKKFTRHIPAPNTDNECRGPMQEYDNEAQTFSTILPIANVPITFPYDCQQPTESLNEKISDTEILENSVPVAQNKEGSTTIIPETVATTESSNEEIADKEILENSVPVAQNKEGSTTIIPETVATNESSNEKIQVGEAEPTYEFGEPTIALKSFKEEYQKLVKNEIEGMGPAICAFDRTVVKDTLKLLKFSTLAEEQSPFLVKAATSASYKKRKGRSRQEGSFHVMLQLEFEVNESHDILLKVSSKEIDLNREVFAKVAATFMSSFELTDISYKSNELFKLADEDFKKCDWLEPEMLIQWQDCPHQALDARALRVVEVDHKKGQAAALYGRRKYWIKFNNILPAKPEKGSKSRVIFNAKTEKFFEKGKVPPSETVDRIVGNVVHFNSLAYTYANYCIKTAR